MGEVGGRFHHNFLHTTSSLTLSTPHTTQNRMARGKGASGDKGKERATAQGDDEPMDEPVVKKTIRYVPSRLNEGSPHPDLCCESDVSVTENPSTLAPLNDIEGFNPIDPSSSPFIALHRAHTHANTHPACQASASTHIHRSKQSCRHRGGQTTQS